MVLVCTSLSGGYGHRAVFPACVGYPKYDSAMVGWMEIKKHFLSNAVTQVKRGILKLNYLIWHSAVNNWDDGENLGTCSH